MPSRCGTPRFASGRSSLRHRLSPGPSAASTSSRSCCRLLTTREGSRGGIVPTKIFALAVGVSSSHDDNTFRCSQEWRTKFVVMYAGNIGYPQAFGDLLAAAKTLNGRDDIHFVFVGGGARGAHVQATATELGLTNVAFLPFQHSRHTLSQIMSAADLHFVTLRDECVGLAVPSKAYAAFAAGRPVLYQGAAEGEIAMLVREHSAGTVLPTGRPDRLAEAIRHYADDRDRWAKECEAARALANLNRKGRVSVLRLAEVFDEASATSNPRRRRATN